jgi:hypothetical protein
VRFENKRHGRPWFRSLSSTRAKRSSSSRVRCLKQFQEAPSHVAPNPAGPYQAVPSTC